MLLSEDDFASNITEQIMFGGLVTYKPILANIVGLEDVFNTSSA